jgi:hypothetical protein
MRKGELQRKIADEIADRFDRGELEIFVQTHFNLSLDEMVGEADFEETAFKVVGWVFRQEDIPAFLAALRAERPNSTYFARLTDAQVRAANNQDQGDGTLSEGLLAGTDGQSGADGPQGAEGQEVQRRARLPVAAVTASKAEMQGDGSVALADEGEPPLFTQQPKRRTPGASQSDYILRTIVRTVADALGSHRTAWESMAGSVDVPEPTGAPSELYRLSEEMFNASDPVTTFATMVVVAESGMRAAEEQKQFGTVSEISVAIAPVYGYIAEWLETCPPDDLPTQTIAQAVKNAEALWTLRGTLAGFEQSAALRADNRQPARQTADNRTVKKT